MNQSLRSRSGLLAGVTGVHLLALGMLLKMASTSNIVPPQPLPMVIAEVMPMQQPKTEVPRSQPPAETKPVQKPTPKPVAKPLPKTTDSDKALTAPKQVEQPKAESAKNEPAPTVALPAPPSPPAPAAPPAPLVPPRFNAAYLNNPAPVYPPLLRRAGEEGRVVLRVFVTPEGTAGEVRVLTPSSSNLFDEAAMAAVRKWRFVPARRGDTPVAEWVQVPIDFKLN